MKTATDMLQKYGYGVFVTALVMALGFFSWRLRGQTGSAAAEHTTAVPLFSPVPVPTAAPTPVPEPIWHRPVSGGVLAPFDYAAPVWNPSMDCWQVHAGVDLTARRDEPVLAAAAGSVSAVNKDTLLGLTVVLDHPDGWQSIYACLSSAAVKPGDHLRADETVGTAGDTADGETLLGCHLHFALLKDGLPQKPYFQ